MTDLWYGTSGPPDSPIVLIGESWGSEEARHRKPFVGSSGTELNRILSQAGVSRDEIFCTNTVAAQPPGNEMWRFFEPKDRAIARVRGLAPSHRVIDECRRLYSQISSSPRKLVIAAGNYALWATSQHTGAEVIRESNGRAIPRDLQTWAPNGIMTYRGSMTFYDPIASWTPQSNQQIPLLPIIHPAAIMRAWYLRDVTIHDLKMRIPQALKDDWRYDPPPRLECPPTLQSFLDRSNRWLTDATPANPVRIASDIETARGLITCIGFADSSASGTSIPFIRRTDGGHFDSYWPPGDEAQLIGQIRRIFLHPHIHIVGQNFVYDTQYIQHYLGVTPHLDFDTMLAQNVLFPGTPKDLGYLSSLYCNYHWYWKDDVKEWNLKGSIDELLLYNAWDCVRTWEISEAQRQLIQHLEMQPQMDFKMETSRLCLRMMNRGVLINSRLRGKLIHDLHEASTALQSELLQIIPQDWIKPHTKRGETFWYTSDKQTKELFYDLLGFRMIRHRKTGRPTTGKEALMQFKKLYPEFTGLIDRLDLLGSLENTLQVLKSPLDPDERMRCSYNPGGTETHRLSSSENAFGRGTNLQNLTKGEEDD